MGFTSKKTKRLIAASLLTGSFILAPEVCDFPFSSVAYTEVKMYMGTAEDYASPIESQDVAKLRAREKAIQRAKEQAGVVLRNYTKMQNLVVTDDEISTIASNTYQIIGEPVYERIIQNVSDSTVIIWKATVQVNVDDSEVRNWVNSQADKAQIVKSNKKLQEAFEDNSKQVDALRQRVKDATTDAEQSQIKSEFDKLDQEFLYLKKIEEGERLDYKENFQAAVKSYSEAIALNPDKALAYHKRGCTYTTLGSLEKTFGGSNGSETHKKALKDFDTAIALKPDYSAAYGARGFVYYFFKNMDQFIEDVDKAIILDPTYARNYMLRALYYNNVKKDYDKGLENQSKAIELEPNNTQYYLARGTTYSMHKKNYSKAIDDFTKAIEVASNANLIGHCYYGRAEAYENEKLYDKAIEDYTKAIEVFENNGQNSFVGYMGRSGVYKKLGNKEKATADKMKYEELYKKFKQDAAAKYKR